jgi:hypothetical protein
MSVCLGWRCHPEPHAKLPAENRSARRAMLDCVVHEWKCYRTMLLVSSLHDITSLSDYRFANKTRQTIRNRGRDAKGSSTCDCIGCQSPLLLGAAAAAVVIVVVVVVVVAEIVLEVMAEMCIERSRQSDQEVPAVGSMTVWETRLARASVVYTCTEGGASSPLDMQKPAKRACIKAHHHDRK